MDTRSIGGSSKSAFPHNIAKAPTSLRCSDCGITICLRLDLNMRQLRVFPGNTILFTPNHTAVIGIKNRNLSPDFDRIMILAPMLRALFFWVDSLEHWPYGLPVSVAACGSVDPRRVVCVSSYL